MCIVFQKCLRVEMNETAWSVKQRVMQALAVVCQSSYFCIPVYSNLLYILKIVELTWWPRITFIAHDKGDRQIDTSI